MTDDDLLLDLFLHPGWKRFQIEMSEAHEMLIGTCHQLKDAEAFFHRKGQIQQLGLVCNYETLTKARVDAENEDDPV